MEYWWLFWDDDSSEGLGAGIAAVMLLYVALIALAVIAGLFLVICVLGLLKILERKYGFILNLRNKNRTFDKLCIVYLWIADKIAGLPVIRNMISFRNRIAGLIVKFVNFMKSE